MVLSEDQECGVCYERYSRNERVPRVLYCNHTFCGPCLETMATQRGGMLSIRCPLCRQVSCMRHGLTLQEALWVNSHLWDRIAENQELEVEEEDEEEDLEEECEEEDRRSGTAQVPSPTQPECHSISRLRPSSKHNRLRIRLPAFLRRMIVPWQQQERIVPGCNVQIKSWRRL